MMNKILFLSSVILGVVFVILLLTTFSSNAYACQCVLPEPTEQFLFQSEHAFFGTVTEIDNSIGPQMVLFDVELDIKGNIESDKYLLTNTHKIRNSDDSYVMSSCDAGFVNGTTYTVYVIGGTADMCTATKTQTFIMTPIVTTNYNFIPIIFITIGIVVFSLYIWKKRQ